MAYSLNFDRKMKRVLGEQIPNLKWKVGWGPKGYRWKVDIAGLKDDKPVILIEAELKKEDPAANVIKVWRWAIEQKNKKRIHFIQGFSKLYWHAKIQRRERTEFIGERMAKDGLNIDYSTVKISARHNGRTIHFLPKTAKGFKAKAGAGALARAR